jgi:hypothetical protein
LGQGLVGTWKLVLLEFRSAVDEAHQVVTHHVTTSLFPNWVGTDQKRFYKLSGARLIISTPTIPVTGHLMDVMLIWQRVA